MSDVPTEPEVEPAPDQPADAEPVVGPLADEERAGESGEHFPQGEVTVGEAVPSEVEDPGQPEQTDNSVKEEDGEQDVDQEEAPAEGSV